MSLRFGGMSPAHRNPGVDEAACPLLLFCSITALGNMTSFCKAIAVASQFMRHYRVRPNDCYDHGRSCFFVYYYYYSHLYLYLYLYYYYYHCYYYYYYY